LELDIDFSLDEDVDLSVEPLDITLDIEPISASPPPKSPELSKPSVESIDTDSGLELDIDFSLDEDVAIPDTPLSPTEPKSPPKQTSISKPIDTDTALELDIDFSTNQEEFAIEGSPKTDNNKGFEIDEISDFDFDFSSEEDASQINIDSEPVVKAEKQQNVDLDAISPMDMDFSDDKEFEKNKEEIINNDDEEDYSESYSPIADTNPQEEPQTTLGGDPIKPKIKESSTLLGDKTNLFENSPLFEKRQPFGVGKIILILLILILLAIGGYAASIIYGVKIPYISDIKIPYIEKFIAPKSEPIRLVTDQATVSGRFITNSVAGTLFAITGNVVNHSKTSCKDVKVEGTLIDTNKTKIKTKVVLCGNILSEEQLKTLDMNAINSILYSSDQSKKFTVEPSKSIPFMVVFSDFPDNLENFTVVVTDFKQVEE
ncbi:MAG: DUF3426 domain-containing protein, partial [Desulfamplus sp.]|nr:DUF3426 domain-containing protein [Desulfamplus sp.]